MCEDCGCGDVVHHHHHDGHTHTHDHGHHHDHDHESKTVVLETKVLSRNDEVAEQNRQWLSERGVVAINLISSPGTGKTLLLEKTLEHFAGKLKCAVIAGDQQTDNDAKRLQGKDAKVVQIETVNSCHLDAERVAPVMKEVVEDDTKVLFIENVGNLVCPSAFDLGETFKISLLSVTEGEDKPLKYPSLFSRAPVAVLTKTDLLPHLDCDIKLCRENLRKINPGVFIVEVSSKSGEGMDAWFNYLESLAR